MVAIGLLGLDTSHADAFARVIDADDDASVTAVWDGGDVRSGDYARRFVDRYDASLYDDPIAMTDVIDAAMVLTVDWDTHAPLAEPFLEEGIPTLVDKPLAGRLADVETLDRASAETPLFGGSAVPYHPNLADLLTSGPGSALYCVGCNHPFYYGAHLADVVRTLAGTDWHSVKPAEDPGVTVDIVFENDTYATVRLDGPAPPSGGDRYLVLSTDQARSIELAFDDGEHERVYRAYVDEFLEAVRGTTDARDGVLDAGRLLLAIHAAIDHGQVVTPGSDDLADYHVDGAAFLEEYRS